MRRILSCLLPLFLSVSSYAQNDNPVVMTVNGYDVSKSEFEYFFSKNNTETKVTRKTVKEYADLYLNFKLKVQAAIDEGMDKSESFLSEYKMYRDLQAEDYLIDKDFIDEVVRRTYEQSIEEIGPDGLVHLYIISSAPDDDTPQALAKSVELMESVYGMLEAGNPFQLLAQKYSDDGLAESGGLAGWVSRSQLPNDVADIVFELEDGQYSDPFVSDGIVFIVMVDAHRQLGTFAENREDIYRVIMESDAVDEAKRRKANEYASNLGWTIRDEEAVAHLDSVLEIVEPDFGNISREYHDGLLLFDISNRKIWERISSNPDEVEAYYKSHAKQFRFKEPCFKGIVLFCQNEGVYDEVKAILDGVDMEEWIDRIVDYNRNGIKVRVMKGSSETGLFMQGQNAYVDKIVFGKGEYTAMDNFPYVNVIGRVIKQPDSFRDVAGQVTEEYQDYLEKEWITELRKKYDYKINRKALKKVSLD